MSAVGLIEAMQTHAQPSGTPAGYAVTVGVASLATLAALTSRGAGVAAWDRALPRRVRGQ